MALASYLFSLGYNWGYKEDRSSSSGCPPGTSVCACGNYGTGWGGSLLTYM